MAGATEYHVFCDESHIGERADGFRIQGGLWVPTNQLRQVRQVFGEFRSRHAKLSELKWQYVSGKYPLAAYTELVDLFFQSPIAPFLSFKCLVVQGGADPTHGTDKTTKDLGFYKAYYTLLRWRLAAGSTNHIRLDKKSGPRLEPERELADCLNAVSRRVDPPFEVASCQAIPSKGEDLIQLVDVLCGAVGWAWNGMRSTCGAKPTLHSQICGALGWRTLAGTETRAAAQKFNVWRYRPKT